MDEFVVARIGKAHGLKGEVTVQVHTDNPAQRLTVGTEFATKPAAPGPLVIRSVRVHQGVYLIGFDGHPDRTAAESLRGVQLIAGAEEAEPDDDAFYPDELTGMDVHLVGGGGPVGTVSDLITRPAQDLLVVTLPGGQEVLIPFVAEIVPEVDLDAGRVLIDPPPGLLDLNDEAAEPVADESGRREPDPSPEER